LRRIGASAYLLYGFEFFWSREAHFMKVSVLLLLSAALAAPSGSAFAADPAGTRYCTDSIGRRIICPTLEEPSIGDFAADLDPLLVGGGLVALGGVAGGALALGDSRHGSGGWFSAVSSASP
jgi:hypothetical protein